MSALTPLERLAFGVYRAATWAAQPWVKRRLLRRAALEPLYAQHLPERFGHLSAMPWGNDRPIWVHAVSLGETRAATELIASIALNTLAKCQNDAKNSPPMASFLLTHGTATGREAGAAWVAQHAARLNLRVAQAWAPWDNTASVQRFLRHARPQAVWLMETEVWPVMLHQTQAMGIPVSLVNARMNPASLRKAQRLAALARPAYIALHQVLAQTPADAQRLEQLGARVSHITGNIKFDAPTAPDLQQTGLAWRAMQPQRPAVLLASSREGEEALFLEHFSRLASEFKDSNATKIIANQALHAPRLLIVPRHPQRFDEVAAMVRQAGLSVSRRSQWGDDGPVSADAQGADVWLGDSMGEMALYASVAQVALLGASFAPLGGQNLIELLANGCPVVMGPHTFNFADAAQLAHEAGVALSAPQAQTALDTALALLRNPQTLETLARASTDFVATNRGAMARTVQALHHSPEPGRFCA